MRCIQQEDRSEEKKTCGGDKRQRQRWRDEGSMKKEKRRRRRIKKKKKRKEHRNRRRKTKRLQEKRVVEKVQRFHQKYLWKRRRGKAKMVFPHFDNQAKFRSSQCGFGSKTVEGRLVQMNEKMIFRQEKNGKAEMRCRKASKTVRCTLLNVSAWCTERKYVTRNRGTFDVFFGIDHRMRKEEKEEQFNKESKQGWRLAAGHSKDHRRTCKQWGSQTYVKRSSCCGQQQSWISYKRRRRSSHVDSGKRKTKLPQRRVNVRRGIKVFAVYIWHSEGWTSEK